MNYEEAWRQEMTGKGGLYGGLAYCSPKVGIKHNFRRAVVNKARSID